MLKAALHAIRRLPLRYRTVILTVSLAACGGGTSDTAVAPTPSEQPSISLTAAGATLTISAGTSQTLSGTVTRGGGYTGAVTVVAEGAPAGVVITVATIATGTSAPVSATVSVATTTTPGTYPITLRATGNGVTAAVATVSLIVLPPPSFSASASPTALSIVQGAQATSTVTVARINMTEVIATSLTGMPSGVTASIVPDRIDASAAVITVSAGAAAPPGAFVLQLVLTASSGTVTVPIAVTIVAAPSYALTLSPTTVSVVRGGSITSELTIARTNFTDAVTLTASGMPNGMTVSFAPTTPTGTTSTITVAATSGVTAGSYPISITGTGSAGTRNATLTVTVLAPSLALTLSPTSASTGAGATVTTTAAIARTNMTAAVQLLLQPLTGFTLTSTPASITGDAATLSIAVASSVTPGTYPLSLRAVDAATGNTVVSAPTTFTVTVDPPSGPIVFDYTGCNAAVVPLWMAVQDGPTAPWVPVPNVNNVFTFTLTQNRVGFAYVWSTTFRHHVIRYATRTELVGTAGRQCAPDQTTAALRLVPPDLTTVYKGTFSNLTNTAQSTGPTLLSAVRGIGIATAHWVKGGEQRLTLLRNIDTRSLSSTVITEMPVSFATATPMTVSEIPILNRGSRNVQLRSAMFYARFQGWRTDLGGLGTVCGRHDGLYFLADSTTATATVAALPLSALLAGETQGLHIQTIMDRGVLDHEEWADVYYRGAAPTSITLVDPMPDITPTVVSTIGPRLRMQIPLPAGATSAGFYYSGTAGGGTIAIGATVGYLNGAGFDLTTPDFRGLSGYSDSWATLRTVGDWTANVVGGTVTTDVCTAGSGTIFTQMRQGSFSVR